jgi:hypothetical protein
VHNDVELDEINELLSEVRIDYSASAIAQLLETLNEVSGKLSSKSFYDEKLGQEICAAMAGIVKSLLALKPVQVDLSPLIAEMVKQNKAILDIISRKEAKHDDSKYQELLKMTLDVIARNNSFMQRMIDVPRPEVAATVVDKRPTEWELETTKDMYGNFKTKAKAK